MFDGTVYILWAVIMSQAMWFSKVRRLPGAFMRAKAFYDHDREQDKAARARHANYLREKLRLQSFDDSRLGRETYASKRVIYVGWAEWCRLTRNVPPNRWVTVKSYGFRGLDGNLYKLGKRY